MARRSWMVAMALYKPLLVATIDGEAVVLVDPATGNSNVLSY